MKEKPQSTTKWQGEVAKDCDMLLILPLKADNIGADVVYNELNPYSSKIISACTLRTAVGLKIASVNNNSRSFASNYSSSAHIY